MLKANNTLTIVNKRVIIVATFICLCFSIKAKKTYGEDIPQMITKEYKFMNEVSDYIMNTERTKLYPDDTKVLDSTGVYDLSVEYFDQNTNSYKRDACVDFSPNGSYRLNVAYRKFHWGIQGLSDVIFYINKLKFATNTYLNGFFIACNREKVPCYFNSLVWILEYLWTFEIRQGEIVEANYFYEPCNGPKDIPGYDLLHGKFLSR